MAKKLYVGNLPYEFGSDQLTELFAQVGEVETAVIITDRDTGRSKGFGFVEMTNDEDAKAAITKFDGFAVNDRNLKVNEARPMEKRDDNRSGGGGGSFNRGGGGGGNRNRGERPFQRRSY